jgi:uncharacterized OB-fold protein
MIAVIECAGKLPRLPRHSQLTRWFWEGLDQGVLQTTRCADCGRRSFPPRPDCPDCLGQRAEWQILPPGGTLYSRTRIHVVPEAFIEAAPLDVGIVDLEVGLRLLCSLVDGAEVAPLDSSVGLVALRYANGTVIGARPVANDHA